MIQKEIQSVPKTLLPAICATAFIVFAQTFMIAPIIPALAREFGSSIDLVALAVPAYILPQGVFCLLAGPLSDRFGRRSVIYFCVAVFTILTILTPLVHSVQGFIAMRVVTGLAGSGIVPICLTLIGDVFPFERRGKAVGWMFGAIAGGTATGAAAGALLEPWIGWHGLFWVISGFSVLLLLFAYFTQAFPKLALPEKASDLRQILGNYKTLLQEARAQRTYTYIFLNAVLQSGVFTWLGVYLHQHYGLDETGIGLALLGYGIPGLLLGPVIGRLADHYGRSVIVPSGIAVTGLCALALIVPMELVFAQAVIIFMSLGFDLAHPQLAAITTDLKGPRGQAVALTAVSLFVGFAMGSLIFQALLQGSFSLALTAFGVTGVGAAGIGLYLFRGEVPKLRKSKLSKQ